MQQEIDIMGHGNVPKTRKGEKKEKKAREKDRKDRTPDRGNEKKGNRDYGR